MALLTTSVQKHKLWKETWVGYLLFGLKKAKDTQVFMFPIPKYRVMDGNLHLLSPPGVKGGY